MRGQCRKVRGVSETQRGSPTLYAPIVVREPDRGEAARRRVRGYKDGILEVRIRTVAPGARVAKKIPVRTR